MKRPRFLPFAAILGLVACSDANEPTSPQLAPPRFSLVTIISRADLGALAGNQNEALFVNKRGQIAGWGQAADGNYHVLFWSSGVTPLTDLGTFGGLTADVRGLDNVGRVLVNSLDPAAPPPYDGKTTYIWRSSGTTTIVGIGSYGVGLNNLGQITGTMKFPVPGGFRLTGFLYSGGVFTQLSGLAGPGSFFGPSAINDNAQIAGGGYTGTGTHAALWEQGVTTDLGTLGGPTSGAVRINQNGHVVGQSCRTGEVDPCGIHAFFWADGVMTDLGSLGGSATYANALNNSDQVAGVSETASGDQHAFLWQAGVMTDLGTLGGSYSRARDVNDAGEVVGEGPLASGAVHTFSWTATGMVNLGTLGGSNSIANAINSRGDIVGAAERAGDPPNKTHATLWTARTLNVVAMPQ